MQPCESTSKWVNRAKQLWGTNVSAGLIELEDIQLPAHSFWQVQIHAPQQCVFMATPGLRKHPSSISLGDGGFCANSVGFWWSSSLLPYLCPLGVS